MDSTPIMANTKQNNPKSFAKSKFSKENHQKGRKNNRRWMYTPEILLPVPPSQTPLKSLISEGFSITTPPARA